MCMTSYKRDSIIRDIAPIPHLIASVDGATDDQSRVFGQVVCRQGSKLFAGGGRQIDGRSKKRRRHSREEGGSDSQEGAGAEHGKHHTQSLCSTWRGALYLSLRGNLLGCK